MRSENELPSACSISAVSVSVDSEWCWPSGICAQTENDRPCLWREGGMEGWREGGEGGGQRLTHRCAQASQLHTEQVVKGTELLDSLCLLSRSPIDCEIGFQPFLGVPQDAFKSRRVSIGFRVSLCCRVFGGVRRLRCHQSSVPIRNERRSESFLA